MSALLQDLRYAVRMLARAPGFTAVAVATLALGIGANTAIFSVVNGVLMQPLALPEADRLMAIESTGSVVGPMSFPDFEDFRREARSFETLAAYDSGRMTLTGAGEAERLPGAYVSANWLDVLRVKPSLGRTFLPEEDKPRVRVVMLSDAMWKERFKSDAAVIGKTANLDGEAYIIVGVMPAGFRFPVDAAVTHFWTTLSSYYETQMVTERGNHAMSTVGRLRTDVAAAEAQREVAAISARIEEQYPADKRNIRARAVLLKETLVGETRTPLLLLAGAVGFVLLIACANVSNLLLARATTRLPEVSVRVALGASRGQILRQMMTESLLLSLIGGAAGLLLAIWATEGLLSLAGSGLPRADEVRVEPSVLVFTLLISMATGIAFGLIPALHALRGSTAQALREGARTLAEGWSGRSREVLVAGEVALASTLLVSAGLLVHSLWKLQLADPGFDPREVVTLRVGLPEARYSQSQRVADFFGRLHERLQALPGVESASAVTPLPMGGMNIGVGFNIEGNPVASDDPFPFGTQFRTALPGYFETMRIPLRAGRDFDERDHFRAPKVAIINQAFAEKYFPGENPLGRRVNPSLASGQTVVEMREIVGVVGNVKFRGVRRAEQPEIYVPQLQLPLTTVTLTVRAAGTTAALSEAVRREVQTLDAEVPVFSVQAMSTMLATSVSDARFQAALLAMFAGAALLMTAIGLYGVIAYSVAQRTREIGIRMALGASGAEVLRMIARRGALLTVIGLGVGVAGALALSRFLSTFLFGVSATNLGNLIVVAAILGVVAFAAVCVPAWRASRIDPMVALRHE